MLDFLRDKFTATDLYLFLQKETSALYRQMYELAHRAADEAQRAFNFERGHTTWQFIPEEIWDNLHEGLMAGERLDFALHQMEKAYLDENVRKYELTNARSSGSVLVNNPSLADENGLRSPASLPAPVARNGGSP